MFDLVFDFLALMWEGIVALRWVFLVIGILGMVWLVWEFMHPLDGDDPDHPHYYDH